MDVKNFKLLPHHRQELQASGLSDETIKAAGIHSEDSIVRLRSLLDWPTMPKKLAPAIVFPFFSPDGDIVCYRTKPDVPRTRKDTKIKYESAPGRPNSLYIPPGTLSVLDDAEVGLIITEGEKKALCADQRGFRGLGLVGVYGWKVKDCERLIPALDRVKWRGRKVYVVFDSDIGQKPEVLDAAARLAQQLKNRGAVVKIGFLPDGDNGKKVGLDDFLVANSAADLHKLLEVAEEPPPIDPATTKAKAATLDPHTLAVNSWPKRQKPVRHDFGITGVNSCGGLRENMCPFLRPTSDAN